MRITTLVSIVLCLIVAVSARSHHKASKKKDYEYDYGGDYAGNNHASYSSVAESHGVSAKSGYSAGSGLRSIAQGSADQANSAVANQHAAAKQAAFVAKNTLAQQAVQASATAQAALAGKQVLLQGLEQQSIEAHQALDSEIQQLQQAKRSAKAAQQSAQQALNHVAVLTAALNNAQSSSDHAQQAATEAAAELASQTAMVGTAKARLESIEEQLHAARIDFEATQAAAAKAAASAQEAQNNAAEAAVHAQVHTHDSIGHGSDTSDHQIEDVATNHNYGEFQPSSPSHSQHSHQDATSYQQQQQYLAGY
uniref:Putative prespore vesicle protein n=1 Tax=Lutzomyia longipalpis TaxID=7200 RepID=A0A1B0CJ04_LUTLO